MAIYYEEGDLFKEHIDDFCQQADVKVYGEHWKLYGRWVYDEDNLIALFSKPYHSKIWAGAYAIRKGYESRVKLGD